MDSDGIVNIPPRPHHVNNWTHRGRFYARMGIFDHLILFLKSLDSCNILYNISFDIFRAVLFLPQQK